MAGITGAAVRWKCVNIRDKFLEMDSISGGEKKC